MTVGMLRIYLIADVRTGSIISGRWLYRNSVKLNEGVPLISSGAGVPLNRSGAIVRYPARAKLSARLFDVSLGLLALRSEFPYSLFWGSWIPKTSVRYKTAVSDFLPVT